MLNASRFGWCRCVMAQRGLFDYVDTGGDDTMAAYRRFLADMEPDLLLTPRRSVSLRAAGDATARRDGSLVTGYVMSGGCPCRTAARSMSGLIPHVRPRRR